MHIRQQYSVITVQLNNQQVPLNLYYQHKKICLAGRKPKYSIKSSLLLKLKLNRIFDESSKKSSD